MTTYLSRRKFFYGLVFAAALIVSVEALRFVPLIQPKVDAFQEWLERVPLDPEQERALYRQAPAAFPAA